MRHLSDSPAMPAAGRARADVFPPDVAVERLSLPKAVAVPAVAVLGGVAAAALAWWLAGFAPEVSREPALANLLRGMAVIKGFAVVAAVALLAWRVRYPLSARMTAAYVVPCWVAAGAAMLIGHLAFVAPAAIAFHAAEFTFLFAAWRDSRAIRGA